LLARCERQLGKREEALNSCRAGRQHYPDDTELLFQEALVRREQGDLEGAEACLLRLLTTKEGPHFASVDPGLRGYKARYNLGIICREQGRPQDAEEQWRAALRDSRDYVPAWLALGELYLAQGRWADLDRITQELLASERRSPVEGTVLRARGCLARREFGEARRWLEEAVTRWPQEARPHVFLSHALLQEGKDWAAAERALRTLLSLDAQNGEAKRNLVLLLRQQGRTVEAACLSEEEALAAMYEAQAASSS
jgi:tetratricopeptide (TPR) repeat protein